jgi:hypothetical protein
LDLQKISRMKDTPKGRHKHKMNGHSNATNSEKSSKINSNLIKHKLHEDLMANSLCPVINCCILAINDLSNINILLPVEAMDGFRIVPKLLENVVEHKHALNVVKNAIHVIPQHALKNTKTALELAILKKITLVKGSTK